MTEKSDNTAQQDNKQASSKEKKNSKLRLAILTAILGVLFILLSFVCVQLFFQYGLDSYFVKKQYSSVVYSPAKDITSAVTYLADKSSDEIKNLPTIYAIPIDQYVSPKPKAENYNRNYTKYKDETIEANYFSETYYDSTFHFIDVKIAHPSQIRMALAGNKYGSTKLWPQIIAKKVNAVAAVDGTYYNVRTNGVLYYQGKLYRNKAKGWDILLIDSDGNLHVEKDRDITPDNPNINYEIVNSFTFGPALVLDGEVQPTNTSYGFPDTLEPRTAIGQLGRLHYLLCTVDGRQDFSPGVTQHQLAVILAKKGCRLAYNLDGGQSTTLVMGGRVKNSVAYGGQRKLGDILYFATALPEENQ